MREDDNLIKTIQSLKEDNDRLREVLWKTRFIVCEGAKEGFNPSEGTWAERLFLNNANIAKVLDK